MGAAAAGDGGTSNRAGAPSTAGTSLDSGGDGAVPNGDALSVVSISPADGESSVERDVTIEVTFSAPVAAKTITAKSFSVTGPDGDVVGKLSVDGVTATFTPETAWSLLADYTVELAGSISSVDASQLDEAQSFAFQTRDGHFGAPKRLLSRQYNFFPKPIGTKAGHVALNWSDGLSPSSMLVNMFDPKSETWSETSPARGDAQNSYGDGCIGLSESGQAFAVASGTAPSWNRYDGVAWGTPTKLGVGEHDFRCALADDGTALLVWEVFDGSATTFFAATQSSNNQRSATKTLWIGGTVWGVRRLGPGLVVFIAHQDDRALYAHVYRPADGWLAPQAITAAGADVNVVAYDTDESAAIFVWADASKVMKASVFDGTTWTVHDLGSLSSGASGAGARVGRSGHIVSWGTGGNNYAAQFTLAGGWGEPAKLGAAIGIDYGQTVEVDTSGNALAAWSTGSAITWRRAPHGTREWSDVHLIEDQDAFAVFSTIDASGNVMLVWSNPLGVWASRFD